MKIQTIISENTMHCPECGGPAFDNLLLAEKKDACYHKVKATAKVWPSAYASGRLVQCRKKGAANWGNKSESISEAQTQGEATLAKIAVSGDDGYEMIYDGLNGLLGTESQLMLQDMYDNVSRQHRLHPDDNAEEIVDRMMDNIEADYGTQGVAEASPEATFNALKGLKSWQVVIRNNYYNGKYSDYSGRYYYVLATSPEEAEQVVLDNADAILQELLSMKSHNGKKILPRSSAIPITDRQIGEIKDGTEAGRMSTAGYKRMFSPQGPMMVKLDSGAIADVQGQEQGMAEGGPFSYGAKKPRQGSVADLAAKKRKEQERGKQPVEPRDHQVGVARVTKGVAEMRNTSDPMDDMIEDYLDYLDSVGMLLRGREEEKAQLIADLKSGVTHSSEIEYALSGTKWDPLGSKGVAEGNALAEEFDLIESIIDRLAEHNGVDAELIWEDLDSLTDDELYVFAVTTPLMEDWQKVNKQDRTAGMSQKAVNAYRRENPGSKLKTAVTTKPSKLKRGSKASKRRSSYCSRSRGQMKMHSISCAKTPDKAICKARRRWNCESVDNASAVIAEMDKSQPSHGRDGRVSHSTYGSRDKKGTNYFSGKEAPGKPVTAKQMSKDALDILKKQGVAEGAEDNPVANAIYRRLMNQKPDLFSRYGLEYVAQAVQDVADSVGRLGPDDEIGSSDVSGWVRQVESNLQNKLNQYDEPMSDIDRMEETHRPGHQSSKKPNDLIGGRYDPDEFDQMVLRLKAMAQKQERERGPVDLAALARRLHGGK